jgi:hypothetical protein
MHPFTLCSTSRAGGIVSLTNPGRTGGALAMLDDGSPYGTNSAESAPADGPGEAEPSKRSLLASVLKWIFIYSIAIEEIFRLSFDKLSQEFDENSAIVLAVSIAITSALLWIFCGSKFARKIMLPIRSYAKGCYLALPHSKAETQKSIEQTINGWFGRQQTPPSAKGVGEVFASRSAVGLGDGGAEHSAKHQVGKPDAFGVLVSIMNDMILILIISMFAHGVGRLLEK